ncbi:phosphate acetyltransferase [Bifidobacterium animalis]|uniref:phosphate acetyltransferase n=1 Tax=Bifidobacterium animalis TaxID=28025 RepID=UPI001C3F1209|nr:phosphate acetyltransferase [Bifidobacterium animalis]MCR1995746.1 phosphate acetyltransferase [Bifidobacterium animalis subsp. animalis]
MSLKNVSIISPEPGDGRNVVALGVVDMLAHTAKTSIFRPAVQAGEKLTDALLSVASVPQTREQAVGVTLRDARLDKDNARQQIVSKFIDTNAEINPQIRVIVGSDRTNVGDPERFTFNADVSADLQSPVLLSVSSMGRTAEEIRETIDACREVVINAGTQVIGVFITDCTNSALPTLTDEFVSYDLPTWPLPLVELGSDGTNVKAALDAFDEHVDKESLLNVLDTPFVPPTTPFAFQYDLLARAKKDKKTIVLPEGEDDRIITAANYLLQSNVVDLVIIGDRDEILARGEKLGLKALDQAKFVSIDDRHLLDTMVPKLCELRAKKGMTPDVALKTLRDTNYFGTMLIVLGMADGLVSGAISSTANTVRPALQLIKTKPGVSSVSGAFLMCLKDHVSVFADCAINLDPNPQQLADIAIQSAETAKAFSIDPKIGLLSYSTLGSGKGPDVDLVVEATSIAQNKRPDLPIVGPIQFDAAWSKTVAKVKAFGNPIAGNVTVFVFPDLDAGNICYKAVQRTSGAVAIGPVLQGLNRPVNDLSRGALVQDIINTIALTAIEAQSNE